MNGGSGGLGAGLSGIGAINPNGTQTQASTQNYASIENPVECLKEGLR